MEHDLDQTPKAPKSSLTQSTENLNAYNGKLKHKKRAAQRVQKLLSFYPDYSKVSPDYVAAMTEAFAYFSDDVQDSLLNPISGLPSTFRFLPVVADTLSAGRAVAASMSIHAKVAVFENTDAWLAWQAVRPSPCVDIRVEGQPVRKGWWFATEFPLPPLQVPN